MAPQFESEFQLHWSITATIAERKSAIDQLARKLSRRFLERNVHNSGDSGVEQRTRFANIEGVSEPKQVGMNFVHPMISTGQRLLRHRFSPKPTSVATPSSLPKRNEVAKVAVFAALPCPLCLASRTRHGKIIPVQNSPRCRFPLI